MLPATAWTRWLDPTVDDPADLLVPWDEAGGEHLELRPVGTAVNKRRQQRPRADRARRARCPSRSGCSDAASRDRDAAGRRRLDRSRPSARAPRALLVARRTAPAAASRRAGPARGPGRGARRRASRSPGSPSRTGSPGAARRPRPRRRTRRGRRVVAALRRRREARRLPLVVGGRSNGARVACRTAAATGAVGRGRAGVPAAPAGPAGEVAAGRAGRGRAARRWSCRAIATRSACRPPARIARSS